jgi:hypothetical protein
MSDPNREFKIEVTQETIDEAMRAGVTGAEMIALAITKCVPGASDIVVTTEAISFTVDGVPVRLMH